MHSLEPLLNSLSGNEQPLMKKRFCFAVKSKTQPVDLHPLCLSLVWRDSFIFPVSLLQHFLLVCLQLFNFWDHLKIHYESSFLSQPCVDSSAPLGSALHTGCAIIALSAECFDLTLHVPSMSRREMLGLLRSFAEVTYYFFSTLGASLNVPEH